jgi:uncharacterized protein (DUF697 family)
VSKDIVLAELYSKTKGKTFIKGGFSDMFLNHIKHALPGRDMRLMAIIHGTSVEAATVGLATAQIPGDRFIIGGIQIYMIIEIAAEFGSHVTKSGARALFYSTISSVIGPEIANQLVKYVPGIGNIINGSVAASITEMIGWATADYYRNLK